MAQSEHPATGEKSWRALPAHTVLGLLDDSDAVEHARRSLAQIGVPDERIEVWAGPEGAAAMEGEPESKGVLALIAQAVQKTLGQDWSDLERYREEVQAGKSLIAVGYEGDDERDRIEELLERIGAQQRCRVGQWTVTVLD